MNSTVSTAPTSSVAQLLDSGIWSAYQRGILALVALAFLADGIANQALGLAVPALMKDWQLPREAFASVTALGLVGLTIGAAIGGYLGDRFGRRKLLILSTLLFGAMTLAAAFTNGVAELTWVRIFDGLGIGAAIPNGAAMLSELTPQRRRARAIAIGMVFIAVGSVVAGLIAAAVLPTYGWQGLFIVLGIITLCSSLLFVFLLPESPLFLSRRPGREPELRRLLTRCGLKLRDGFVGGDTKQESQSGTLRSLFASGVGTSTIALWTAFFFCLLASYAMFSWIPAMLTSLSFPMSMASLGMTAFSIGGIVGGISGGWFIERIGSRVSVLAMAAGAVVGALLLGGLISRGVSGVAPLFVALAVEGFFISGLHNGLYTLSAHIYPHFARGTGVGAAAAVGRLGAIASSYVGIIALQMGGATSYFAVIAGAAAVSFLGIALIKRQIPATPLATQG
jgi:MFS transporter, AAHS family, 4-hydroxybenzoate transporter